MMTTTTNESNKKDIYQMITDQFIRQLEIASVGGGSVPWQKPWAKVSGAGRAVSRMTGNPYGLLNQMLLSRPSQYASFEQWTENLSGKIVKGSKGETVITYSRVENTETDAEEKASPNYKLRYYKVFPIESVMNVELLALTDDGEHENPIQEAEALVKAYISREGITVIESEDVDEACYEAEVDVICMPVLAKYNGDVARHYVDMFKAIIASTGSGKRLNRTPSTAIDDLPKAEKRENREKLLIEIGASALLNGLGIKPVQTMDETIRCTENCIEKLRVDKYLIFDATSAAERAVKYVNEKAAEMAIAS